MLHFYPQDIPKIQASKYLEQVLTLYWVTGLTIIKFVIL